jgi:hypothetical protein
MSKHGFGRGQKDASRSGYLQKKGPLGVWQKRWFILEKGEVRYYRTHQQVPPAHATVHHLQTLKQVKLKTIENNLDRR